MKRAHRGESRPLGRQSLLNRIVLLRRTDAARVRSSQQQAEIEELRRTTKPGEIAPALAADARTRGL